MLYSTSKFLYTMYFDVAHIILNIAHSLFIDILVGHAEYPSKFKHGISISYTHCITYTIYYYNIVYSIFH